METQQGLGLGWGLGALVLQAPTDHRLNDLLARAMGQVNGWPSATVLFLLTKDLQAGTEALRP